MSAGTFALGSVAVVVLALLPGVALASRRWGRSPLERLGVACAISLSINCFALMLLNVLGLYRVSTAWLWFTLVLIGSCLIAARRRADRRRRETARPSIQEQPSNEVLQDVLALPILVTVFLKTSFFPFSSWDAVASWNRWARDYFLVPNYFSQETFFYPQYHAWALSFPYMLMGDPTIEYFSHAIAVAYLLVLYAGVVRLSRVLGTPAWLAFPALFLTAPMTTWVGSGYADDAAAGFAALSVAVFLEALALHDERRARARALGAGLLSGTAFLFKPSGVVIAFAVFGLGVFLTREKSLPSRARLATVAVLGALLVAAPWLVSGQTALGDIQLKLVMSGVHGSLPQSEIFRAGMKKLRDSGTLLARPNLDYAALAAAFVLALAAMRRGRAALCLGLAAFGVVPVWVNTANYDNRAILPAVPLVVVIAAAGLFAGATRALGQVPGRAVCFAVALASLAMFGIAELDSGGALIDRSVYDPRPGAEWARLELLGEHGEKATRLMPALAALRAWQADHPRFARNVWSDPVIIAALDPRRPNGGGVWIGVLFDAAGNPRWSPGDVLFLSSGTRGEPVRPPWIRTGGNDPTTWAEWLRTLESAGAVRPTGEWGDYAAYEVQPFAPNRSSRLPTPGDALTARQ